MQTAINRRKYIGDGIRTHVPVRATQHHTPVAKVSSRGKRSGLRMPVLAALPADSYTRFVRSLFVIFGLAVVLYFYMVVSIILATVDRKGLEESIRESNTELSYKEAKYSEQIGAITVAAAYNEGYIDAGQSVFATRAEVSTLALRNE